MSLNVACAAVYAIAQSYPSFKKVSRRKLWQFSVDMSLVALSVRSGYLFDAFVIQDARMTIVEILSKLVATLRESLPIFAQVTAVYDRGTAQIFFVNVGRFRGRYRFRELQDRSEHCIIHNQLDPWTAFVSLSSTLEELSTISSSLEAVLSELWLACDSSAVLPPLHIFTANSPLQITELVPFAAFILEYPVAYVPITSEQPSFLADTPLDIYECALTWSTRSDPHIAREVPEHVLLKFSCPSMIGDINPDLSVPRLRERLKARFSPRLKEAGFSGTLQIRHKVESLARVAL